MLQREPTAERSLPNTPVQILEQEGLQVTEPLRAPALAATVGSRRKNRLKFPVQLSLGPALRRVTSMMVIPVEKDCARRL